jgi:hypothetical protein
MPNKERVRVDPKGEKRETERGNGKAVKKTAGEQ